MTRYFKIYILFLFFSLAGFSQISKVHYIPPLTSNKSIAGGSSIPLAHEFLIQRLKDIGVL